MYIYIYTYHLLVLDRGHPIFSQENPKSKKKAAKGTKKKFKKATFRRGHGKRSRAVEADSEDAMSDGGVNPSDGGSSASEAGFKFRNEFITQCF